ncbi:hypothetical protein PAXRUDRAFT_21112 [Paxillus rubicundulus Ve08.2h10]|uniref:Uncharacterized protein n=1 Tax=Paxillus rubicundulus Ve08.2h10 TaxID=930991 RepID=A0A0D0D820_9AGAM|nr:hypothetical protein PAXRUDRAFT_21112 [Paxillus rubicundulus Ve08.2h10]
MKGGRLSGVVGGGADVGFNLCVAPLSEFSPIFTKGGDEEWRSRAEERSDGGTRW